MTTTQQFRNRITAVSAVALLGVLGTAAAVAATPALRGDYTAADGAIADDREVSVFDDAEPAIAKLDEDLRDALRDAAVEAAAGGVPLHVTSCLLYTSDAADE